MLSGNRERGGNAKLILEVLACGVHRVHSRNVRFWNVLTDFIWLNQVRDTNRSPVLWAFRHAVLGEFDRGACNGK